MIELCSCGLGGSEFCAHPTEGTPYGLRLHPRLRGGALTKVGGAEKAFGGSESRGWTRWRPPAWCVWPAGAPIEARSPIGGEILAHRPEAVLEWSSAALLSMPGAYFKRAFHAQESSQGMRGADESSFAACEVSEWPHLAWRGLNSSFRGLKSTPHEAVDPGT